MMILPQVHLREPCYDFYLIQILTIKPICSDKKRLRADKSPVLGFLDKIQFQVATGGVYKGQGRSQRKLMTRTY